MYSIRYETLAGGAVRLGVKVLLPCPDRKILASARSSVHPDPFLLKAKGCVHLKSPSTPADESKQIVSVTCPGPQLHD